MKTALFFVIALLMVVICAQHATIQQYQQDSQSKDIELADSLVQIQTLKNDKAVIQGQMLKRYIVATEAALKERADYCEDLSPRPAGIALDQF